MAAARDVGGPQRGKKLQLLLTVITRLPKPPQQGEAFGQMTDRFAVRRSLPRPQARLEPVADRLLGQPRLGEVVSQQFGLRLSRLRELCYQHLGDPPVELLALVLDQRVIQRVLQE